MAFTSNEARTKILARDDQISAAMEDNEAVRMLLTNLPPAEWTEQHILAAQFFLKSMRAHILALRMIQEELEEKLGKG